MSVQDVLALLTVLGAVSYLIWKLVLVPAGRKKGPHVTTRSLVKRARAKKLKDESGCH